MPAAGLSSRDQISLAEHGHHLNTSGLGTEQKATEQLLIKTGLSKSNHHQHLINIRQSRALQLTAAWLQAGHRSAAIAPVATIESHPVPHHHLLTAIGQASTTSAEELTLPSRARLLEAYTEVIGLKSHHTAP
tara:strand:- start:422 stop:820 length:399 start_codon:yes stop_codon:yes gene_type:complete